MAGMVCRSHWNKRLDMVIIWQFLRSFSIDAEVVWVDQKKDNEVVFAELYDHRKDPQENENVIDSHLYTSEIKRLEKWHTEGWQGTRRALKSK